MAFVPQNLSHILAWLQTPAAQNIQAHGAWSPAQTLLHVAQSIDYSMTGYPEYKSVFFRRTVGWLAAQFFIARKMFKHNVFENIPGAPAVSDTETLANANLKLQHSIRAFQNYTQTLAEHFAFGKLTPAQFDAIHTLHFKDHLRTINLPA